MRLGGFVIHGDNQATLGRCLHSLAAVADACVAVDTGSHDGSAELVLARGFSRLACRWEGYGAARAAAVQALRGCDYVFFLDSDEWLEPAAIAALCAWRRSSPTAAHYALVRRDWAELGGAPFLFRTEHHVRLVRLDAARWTPDMIVHEALPAADTVRLPVALEHRFADDVEAMRGKVEQYALLWAIRFHRHERRLKPIGLQRFIHVLRETLVKGALFRGGIPAFRLARAVAHHHARKYALLREVRGGAYPELVRAFDEGRFAELFRLLPAAASLRAPAPLAYPIHPGALPRSAAVPPPARLAHAPLEIHGSDSR